MNNEELRIKLIFEVFGVCPERLSVQIEKENWGDRTTWFLGVNFLDRFDGEFKWLRISYSADRESSSIDIEKMVINNLVQDTKRHYQQLVENHFDESGLSKIGFVTKHATVPIRSAYTGYNSVSSVTGSAKLVFEFDNKNLDFPRYTPVSEILDSINNIARIPQFGLYRQNYFDPYSSRSISSDHGLVAPSPDGSYYDYIGSPFVASFDCAKPLSTQKGIDLLERWLTDDQLASWQQDQTIPCVGGKTGAQYLITRKSQVNIKVLSGQHSGRKFCIVPTETVTIEDQMLAQKLIIENDEGLLLSKGILW